MLLVQYNLMVLQKLMFLWEKNKDKTLVCSIAESSLGRIFKYVVFIRTIQLSDSFVTKTIHNMNYTMMHFSVKIWYLLCKILKCHALAIATAVMSNHYCQVILK